MENMLSLLVYVPDAHSLSFRRVWTYLSYKSAKGRNPAQHAVPVPAASWSGGALRLRRP